MVTSVKTSLQNIFFTLSVFSEVFSHWFGMDRFEVRMRNRRFIIVATVVALLSNPWIWLFYGLDVSLNAFRTCSIILFPCSSNHIIDLWRHCFRCCRYFFFFYFIFLLLFFLLSPPSWVGFNNCIVKFARSFLCDCVSVLICFPLVFAAVLKILFSKNSYHWTLSSIFFF